MKKIKESPILVVSVLAGVFFLVICVLVPVTGDDWRNYLVGEQGLSSIWEDATIMYKTWEGRFVSRLFIDFFAYYKVLWNVVSSVVMAGICYMSLKLINPKRKWFTGIFFVLSMLLVEYTVFMQGYTWIAGNVTYTFVIRLCIA